MILKETAVNLLVVNARSATATRARTRARHFRVMRTSGFKVVTQTWHKIKKICSLSSFAIITVKDSCTNALKGEKML